MKNLNHRFLAVTAILLASAVSSAKAQVISDTFTADDGTRVVDHTPDSDQPAAAYQQILNGWGYSVIQGGQAKVGPDEGVAISLASAGAYTKPTDLVISSDLNLGNLGFGAGAGVGLGFFSQITSGAVNGSNHFLGLLLQSDGGLELLGAGITSSPIAYSGTFDASVDHTLSYDVNTTLGTVSDVTLDGKSYTFATTAFTDSATAYAGFFGGGTAAGQYGYVDNLSVAAPVVPEPSTLAMLVCGLGGLALFVRRQANRI